MAMLSILVRCSHHESRKGGLTKLSSVALVTMPHGVLRCFKSQNWSFSWLILQIDGQLMMQRR